MFEEPVVPFSEEWALNPAYLTSARMANFRPAYVAKLKKKVRDEKGKR